MTCKHTNTYAVDTHNRIDCSDCDKSWEGPEIVAMEQKLARTEAALKLATAALQYVVSHEEANLEMNADVHRHNRYREHMYWKAKTALVELDAVLKGEKGFVEEE